MRRTQRQSFAGVVAIIPALNEAEAIAGVIQAIHRQSLTRIIVVDNGSTDATAAIARSAGAAVVSEPTRGYGAACLAGIRALPPDAEVVVFLDGDGADDPALLSEVVGPITSGRADLVVGARTGAEIERGALTPQQRIGNAFASLCLRWRFGLAATDLGPFRAIRRTTLEQLRMTDTGYGWTVEMQIKAARHHVRYAEVQVPYRRRIGTSKISGTVRGVVGASVKILAVLARHTFSADAR